MRDCNSIALKLTYQDEHTFLIPSDIRQEDVGKLDDNTDAYEGVDVLLLAHHGVPGAFNEEAVMGPNPESVVISNAKKDSGSNAAKPGEEVLEALADGPDGSYVPTYWTAKHGEITYVVGPDEDDGSLAEPDAVENDASDDPSDHLETLARLMREEVVLIGQTTTGTTAAAG